MEYIVQPERRIPVSDSCDVLVAGGGPAGTAAAVQAARLGADVILLERSGMLGGVATSGLMSHWTGNTRGGIYEEILDRSADFPHDRSAAIGDHGEARQIINHERLRTALLEMCVEAKAKVRLYSWVTRPILDASADGLPRVSGAFTEGKEGCKAIRSKITVDATGDGDVAAAAGVPFHKGREQDGRMQPSTIMLKVGGVDTARVRYVPGFEETYPIAEGDLQSVARKELPYPAGHVLIYPSTLPGIVVLNMTNSIDVDGTDSGDLTKAELLCRTQMGPILEFLRARVPGFKDAFILQSSSAIGVRETRHFQGEATLNEKDIYDARVFDDWVVARAHFNLDVHNLDGAGLDAAGVQKNFLQTKPYTIPYGCLVPQGTDGLLLAGRIISGTHIAHSSFRVMPICANIGQAAGIAAALCARKGLQPRNLEAVQIQAVLRDLGIFPEPETGSKVLSVVSAGSAPENNKQEGGLRWKR